MSYAYMSSSGSGVSLAPKTPRGAPAPAQARSCSLQEQLGYHSYLVKLSTSEKESPDENGERLIV